MSSLGVPTLKKKKLDIMINSLGGLLGDENWLELLKPDPLEAGLNIPIKSTPKIGEPFESR